ncbi:hypothetical protein B0T25DRAFT_269799 [Lasiosphaeria hispida]|uniref:C2H2-type domain-containing protein n=1 Tax=Lasiosphaeria hispida TaxID=260671 RepID=A0AAJ0HAQ0_9PEZI|nr:hypothetical protein B0T25DRAFT_269799 [Lasiosphaeria hispida]
MTIRRVTTSHRKKLANPQESCGREILTTRIGRKRAWWACGSAMKQFESEIEDDLDSALRNTALGYADIYIRLYMIGSRPETAGPIIMVCCSNPTVKDDAESSIRRSGILQKYPEFRLGASALPLEQPQPARALGADTEMEDLPGPGDVLSTSPLPKIGRRLFTVSEDGQGLRSATGGPILYIGDKCYQLTVNHIFEAEEPSPQDTDYDECHFDGQSDDEDDTGSEPDYVATCRGSLSPKTPARSWAESDDGNTEASGSSSQMSVIPSPRSPRSQTSPESPRVAVESPRPTPQHATTSPNRDGLVPAGTAGISSKEGSNRGLDYVLIPVDAPEGANEVQLETDTGVMTLQVGKVAPMSSEEKNIRALTASGGVVRGVLIPGATYFRKANASSLQKIYAVELDGVVVEGDCGAAVMDEKTGDFYGHIVRGCSGTQIAYIVAATDVLEDLRTRLGQDVMLAGLEKKQEELRGQEAAEQLDSRDTALVKFEASKRDKSSVLKTEHAGLGGMASSTSSRSYQFDPRDYLASPFGYEGGGFKSEGFELIGPNLHPPDPSGSWFYLGFPDTMMLSQTGLFGMHGPSPAIYSGSPFGHYLEATPCTPCEDSGYGGSGSMDIEETGEFESALNSGLDSGSCGSATFEMPSKEFQLCSPRFGETSIPRFEGSGTEKGMPKGRCPHPDCGKTFKDLKAHMLTHQTERPEKCPVSTCQHHAKGFARKYDRNRHTQTHYKGTMVCGFCPGPVSVAEKAFNRADVFKRHLTAVHGVEHRPPKSRKKAVAAKVRYAPGVIGKCSTCSQTFANAQDFYEHLDDCVLRAVMEDPAEAIQARRLAEIDKDEGAPATLAKHGLSDVDYDVDTGTESGDEEGECNGWSFDSEVYKKSGSLGGTSRRVKAMKRRRRDGPKSRVTKDDQLPLFMGHKGQVQLGDGHSCETDLGTHGSVERVID